MLIYYHINLDCSSYYGSVGGGWDCDSVTSVISFFSRNTDLKCDHRTEVTEFNVIGHVGPY